MPASPQPVTPSSVRIRTNVHCGGQTNVSTDVIFTDRSPSVWTEASRAHPPRRIVTDAEVRDGGEKALGVVGNRSFEELFSLGQLDDLAVPENEDPVAHGTNHC